MVNVLSSIEATNILKNGVAVVSVSPVAGVSTVGVPTLSGLFPTVSAIFTTTSMVTPYLRRPREISTKDKSKEKLMESEVPKKRKLQKSIDAQVAKEIEEEFARENQRLSEQLARDSKISRLYAKEELKMMIEGLDRSNELIVKHLQEYEQSKAELIVGEKIELINELVKYQDHHAKILKYQAQQSNPLSKKEQKEFYLSILSSHTGWKTKHFRGMTLEEIKEKFIPVWKQLEDFVLMSLKEDVAKEIEEEFARENQRLSEQLARDSKIARLYAKEELKMMIEGLDRSNEVIVKHLQEYEQSKAELIAGEKIELINELVKYQDHHAKILKYQAQQSNPLSKKEQKEFYLSILSSHAGWKTKHFRGMTLEEIKEKFIPVWKQLEDFVLMSLKEEGMMQLVPLEEVYVEALQATKDKEKELWVDLKRLFEPDFEDQLWTHNQAFIHYPLEWKLYDTCSVHHVFTKDQEIFMLVEKDYLLRKGLATVMICNKLQVEQYS
nr:hypothetical protein [Tanacetum cinerariifolium]